MAERPQAKGGDRSDQRSILQLLHPCGRAEAVRVIGEGCAAGFSLCPSVNSQESADLVVIAPSVAERGQPGWWDRAVAEAAAGLRPGGLVYALAGRRERRRLAARFRACGLATVETVLHHPSTAEAQTLIPLAHAPLAYAFGRLIRTNPMRRNLALGLLRLPGMLALANGMLPAVGVIAQQPGSRRPAAWFTDLLTQEAAGQRDGREMPGVVLNRSWRGPEGAVLLHAVSERGGEPVAIAKTWLSANGEEAIEHEARGLTEIAARAGEFGVRVPALLGRGRLGGQPYLVETAVTGERASVVLHNRPEQLAPLLARLTEWLAEWKAATAAPTVLTEAMLDEFLLAPAHALGMDQAYVRYLAGLAARLRGATVTMAATHGDLTMVNVLVARGAGAPDLGVIDWETARPAGLPLADFVYTAVDAVAALDDYRDRPAAFEKCFGPHGEHRELIGRLQRKLTEKLDLSRDEVALNCHAAWLSFALDELRETAKNRPDEFLQIARLAADNALAERGARPSDKS